MPLYARELNQTKPNQSPTDYVRDFFQLLLPCNSMQTINVISTAKISPIATKL